MRVSFSREEWKALEEMGSAHVDLLVRVLLEITLYAQCLHSKWELKTTKPNQMTGEDAWCLPGETEIVQVPSLCGGPGLI